MASQWGVGGAVALGAGFWLGGPFIIDLMSTAPEVRETARAFLPWVAIGPVIAVASYMFDGIFIGATLTREMRNTMIVSVAAYAVAVAMLLPALGNHGLWAALTGLNAMRGLTMAVLYRRAEAAAAPA
jgi:multidrug resistance protein, MATE family